MKTKEAIKFISKHIADFRERTEDADDKEGCKKLIMEAKGVISLLQQGEAYKEMLEDIRLECNDTLIEYPKNKTTYSFNIIFKMFKQKHFPKEAKSDGR